MKLLRWNNAIDDYCPFSFFCNHNSIMDCAMCKESFFFVIGNKNYNNAYKEDKIVK